MAKGPCPLHRLVRWSAMSLSLSPNVAGSGCWLWLSISWNESSAALGATPPGMACCRLSLCILWDARSSDAPGKAMPFGTPDGANSCRSSGPCPSAEGAAAAVAAARQMPAPVTTAVLGKAVLPRTGQWSGRVSRAGQSCRCSSKHARRFLA